MFPEGSTRRPFWPALKTLERQRQVPSRERLKSSWPIWPNAIRFPNPAVIDETEHLLQHHKPLFCLLFLVFAGLTNNDFTTPSRDVG